MYAERKCDGCGRTEKEILNNAPADYQMLEMNNQGLWLCRPCRIRSEAHLTGDEEVYKESELPTELRQLIGKRAGVICMGMDLPRHPLYRQIIDDAALLLERSMSSWPFVTQWNDGSTVWRAPDHSAIVVVRFDGSMRVERV